MSSTRSRRIHIQCPNESDRSYLAAVTDLVLERYDGRGPQWQLAASLTIWPLSLGGRAGVVGVSIENRTCCVKLFYDRRWITRWRTFFGHAKGKTAYRHACRLQEHHVTCPTPLGYAEKRPIGPVLVVTELIADGQRLDHWIQTHGTTLPLIEALAKSLRHMHDSGITHSDLSPRNLLVRPGEVAPLPYLLDYEDARFHGRIAKDARLEDLHHLDERMLHVTTLHERILFLRYYAGPAYKDYCRVLGEKILKSQSKYVRAYRSEVRKQAINPHPLKKSDR